MDQLPHEIEYTYIIILTAMIFFVGFIVFVILLYNRKQMLYIKEKQLKESEHKNQLLEKELEQQKSLEQERHRISGEMHDELGAGISAIKLQSEILKQNIDNKTVSKNEVDELIKISDNMTAAMREMLWSLNTENDTLKNITKLYKSYTTNYFAKAAVRLLFSSKITDKNKLIPSDIRRNLLLVTKEACHNIVKHSHATEVKILIIQTENRLDISISDNGIGIQNETSKGYGLTTMRSRTENIGGSFSIDSNALGTSVKICLHL